MLPMSERGVKFGPFELHRSKRLLLENEIPVRLGGRALDLLLLLVEQAGQVVSHEDLIRQVWGRVVVEDTSLRVNIAALRRALGDGAAGRRYIANVVGRGYSFVGAIQRAPSDAVDGIPAQAPVQSPPPRLTQIVGRDEEVQTLSLRLAEHRFVTIVGHGGMGKTTVALALAQKQMETYGDQAYVVDLASVAAPLLVPAALASALGLDVEHEGALAAVLDRLKDRHALVVLDNCEHLIQAAADLGEAVLRGASGVRLIATSREALDAEGERVYRLGSLPVPAAGSKLTVTQALEFPAIQLFVERAGTGPDGFVLTQANLPQVRQLCLQLDGVPLALELAASHVHTLGVAALSSSLDGMLGLLTRGRRAHLPRHRSLQALLDWSHALLRPDERMVLRRLAVFPGGFSIDAAMSVAACQTLSSQVVLQAVASLVAKSLVVVRESRGPTCFALLHITRAYALDKLASSGEQDDLILRHKQLSRAHKLCEDRLPA